MKLLTVLGARPQFIKAAAVSRVIKDNPSIQEVIVHTGQHFDKNMSDVFFQQMNIPNPAYNLDIHSLPHGAMTGRMIEGIEKILGKENPDVILVYGDTNSTLAGALAAQKLGVKIAHVEAGLRSFNLKMPEEINRILTDRISDYLFCPTQKAIDNLHRESFESFNAQMVLSGDVMLDAALFYASQADQKSSPQIKNELKEQPFILCTCHRQENTDDKQRLSAIVKALNTLSKTYKVVLPLHPRTKKKMQAFGLDFSFTPIDPVGYFDMVWLLKNCAFVITDSGGLQKEAFYFKKYGITLRDQTEWVELIDHGFSELAGADYEKILSCVEGLSQKQSDFSIPLYGNGKASDVIIETLTKQ